MASLSDHPELAAKLRPGAQTTALEERRIGGTTYLRVTQLFTDGEGGQSLFTKEDGKTTLLKTDNAVEFPDHNLAAHIGYDGTMSDAQHAQVAAEAVGSVDVYKTGDGPDRGNRACLWAARHVVFKAVGLWITHQDGTADFYAELKAGGMAPVDDADTLPAGAIIISPTTPAAVGHIGLLGDGHGAGRKVYSNHSPSHADPVARWEQNYTVGVFKVQHANKGLQTLFYRLPKPLMA